MPIEPKKVKSALNKPLFFVRNGVSTTFAHKFLTMKNILLRSAVLAALLSFSSCKDDPYPLELQIFDVRWYDDDNSGTQTAGDALTFGVQINTTNPDSDAQTIREWEFSYYVNNNYGGVLRGDDRVRTNSLFFDAEIFIGNLFLPEGGTLGKGDVVEFRLWARDNRGTELERVHRYVIEE